MIIGRTRLAECLLIASILSNTVADDAMMKRLASMRTLAKGTSASNDQNGASQTVKALSMLRSRPKGIVSEESPWNQGTAIKTVKKLSSFRSRPKGIVSEESPFRGTGIKSVKKLSSFRSRPKSIVSEKTPYQGTDIKMVKQLASFRSRTKSNLNEESPYQGTGGKTVNKLSSFRSRPKGIVSKKSSYQGTDMKPIKSKIWPAGSMSTKTNTRVPKPQTVNKLILFRSSPFQQASGIRKPHGKTPLKPGGRYQSYFQEGKCSTYGQSCSSSTNCCTFLDCVSDPSNPSAPRTCQSPMFKKRQSGKCRIHGEKCNPNSKCCASLICVSPAFPGPNTCQSATINILKTSSLATDQCLGPGTFCSDALKCCPGLTCYGSACIKSNGGILFSSLARSKPLCGGHNQKCYAQPCCAGFVCVEPKQVGKTRALNLPVCLRLEEN